VVRNRESEWAVILAGGDGTRLKSLTRKIAGDERPKQFCSVLGKKTLLEETRDRAALELASQRTLHVVNHAHEPYYGPILGNEPASNLVVQPSNRGTAPAILYSLLRIAAVDAHAVVAFLPSDHYVSDNEKFAGSYSRGAGHGAPRYRFGYTSWIGSGSPEVNTSWIDQRNYSRSIASHGVRRWGNQLLAQVLQLRGCVEPFCDGRLGSTLPGIVEGAPQLYDLCRTRALLTPEANLIQRFKRMAEINFLIGARAPSRRCGAGVRLGSLSERAGFPSGISGSSSLETGRITHSRR
jgi:hypothetical protein